MAPPLLISLLLLSLMSFFQSSSTQPLCREFERLALEQFKNSFLIDKYASGNSMAYPKTDLWQSQGSDCCSWEGITCSQHTGHVVGIELNSSCLFGPINSSSTLFNLGHLRYLNLADNHFNYSSILPAFGNLSRLISLDLSKSVFSGQVPFEISKLSKLIKLDLSWNLDSSANQRLLSLKTQDFKSLIQNLNRLEYLRLSFVNINSSVPYGLANLSSLTYLSLRGCEVFGEFPNAIFQLPKLEELFVLGNSGLTGIFPEFHFGNLFKKIDLSDTSFSGMLPKSMGLLSSLEYLDVDNCNFSGILPPSLSNLTKLRTINLRNNSFEGSMVSFFPNLTQLEYVDLRFNLFTFSEVPSLARSTNLGYLDLSYNQITGPFPSWLTNLTQFTYLDFSSNMIQVELETFLGLQHLTSLSLSYNSFSLDQLQTLMLENNNIHGQIPKWLMEISPNLWYLSLSNNSLTSFEESYVTFCETPENSS